MSRLPFLVIIGMMFCLSAVSDVKESGFDHSYAIWDAWLKKHVKVSGPMSRVKYRKGKKDFKEVKEIYLKNVSEWKYEDYQKFTKDQKLAFLINAYNAFTVQLIMDHYPIKSIKNLGSLFGSPWKKKFFMLFGKSQHLDYIEHELIRKNFDEPRIHFAVVCASISCPMLISEAWTADKLEQQLESSAILFLSDTKRNQYLAKENKLRISKIFDWYKGDFEKKYGSVQIFIAPKMAGSAKEEKKIQKASLEYLDYNWNLNE